MYLLLNGDFFINLFIFITLIPYIHLFIIQTLFFVKNFMDIWLK